ncbi:hypothetical protein CVT24_006101 [Panaeolus cyanescens]|uniref:Exocyst complex component Sec3 PIP2-binding N-terminal domain-containing protein n=1 Tax=Panaeolus cyanescens TaxID=181874 RepID=A0A409VCS8_9AGAR|nr:hypothetical protein CVT24_006101 [Panaeolus cyanescens]
MTDQRNNIINSVFSRRNAAGNLEESYVSHVKIWEDAGPENGGRKPRYILLSQANNGSGFIHKSKLNTNGTFSVGKTWKLAELRAVIVVNPLAFNITLSRTYKWQTENRDDQAAFLEALVRLFRTITNGQVPLQLDGVPDFDVTQLNGSLRDTRRTNTPSPTTLRPSRAPPPSRTPASQVLEQESSRRPRSPSQQARNGYARPESPASLREHRPPSIAVNPVIAPLQPRSRKPSTSNGVPSQTKNESSSSRAAQDLPIPRQRVPSGASSPPPDPRARAVRIDSTAKETSRKDHNARISYFDPTNQAMLDRLIAGSDTQLDPDGEDENAQDTLANVEEMIEGYEWASDDVIGRKMTKGAVDLIEARLLDELMALDKANIHSFLESDDRVAVVMKCMDDALAELDMMESLVSTYKIHLNAVNDDISYIQSQNRGLQVQTQNQKALLGELQNLLRTVHVDPSALSTLTQESLEKSQSITRLEEAAVQLYKALQAGKDTDMAATMERLQEYRTHNAQFCKRLFDFLSIMFIAQSQLLLGDTNGLAKGPPSKPIAMSHRDLETYLGRYSGLMLYLREMDETVYSKLCGAYFSASSDLHSTQIKALLSAHLNLVKKAPEEELEQGKRNHCFGSSQSAPLTARGAAGMRRAGTLIRSPIENRQRERDKEKAPDGEQRASEVFRMFLDQILQLIYSEDEFIADFLQINDAGLTFADYMGLDNYFRRQAARSASLSASTLKIVRGALDLIFGFLPTELKSWLDAALAKDSLEIVGIAVSLERFIVDAEEKSNPFVLNFLEKQHSRLKIAFDRHVNDQLKGIEQTKLSSKKRKGVVQFIKHFSSYAARVEAQLINASTLEIRTSVDSAYEKIIQAMFDSLKQIAKLEGEGEDKGQLNYHIILIENMHFFVAEVSQLDIPSLTTSTRRAEAIYEESLTAYIKISFRRPFGRIIDFFESLDRAAKDSSDITSNSNFNKSALRKVLKDYNTKDMRKHIDVLSKRVEKHFTEGSEKGGVDEANGNTAGTVMAGVWKACEEELVRLTESWAARITQLYGDSGISLEYTVAEVESAFRRQRFGL